MYRSAACVCARRDIALFLSGCSVQISLCEEFGVLFFYGNSSLCVCVCVFRWFEDGSDASSATRSQLTLSLSRHSYIINIYMYIYIIYFFSLFFSQILTRVRVLFVCVFHFGVCSCVYTCILYIISLFPCVLLSFRWLKITALTKRYVSLHTHIHS